MLRIATRRQIQIIFACLNLSIALIASPSFGAKTGPLFEVKFKSEIQDHTYTIVQDGKKPVFKLVFREAGKPLQSKPLTGRQVDQLSAQLTRIAWGSQDRKPASTKVCSKLARIRVRDDKANICSEDTHVANRMVGFVNSLRSEFK